MKFIRKCLSLGIKAEVLQLTFAAGAVAGMTFEAILLTVPPALKMLTGAL